jgi:hypothetical protein
MRYITDEQEKQAAELATDLFCKKIIAEHMNITVAVLMAEHVISMCLGGMCPGCRDDHWHMLLMHFSRKNPDGIRSRAEELYKIAHPNKPPICDRHPVN